MLIKKNFSVVFEAGTPPVRFREEYLLPVRTEEEQTDQGCKRSHSKRFRDYEM